MGLFIEGNDLVTQKLKERLFFDILDTVIGLDFVSKVYFLERVDKGLTARERLEVLDDDLHKLKEVDVEFETVDIFQHDIELCEEQHPLNNHNKLFPSKILLSFRFAFFFLGLLGALFTFGVFGRRNDEDLVVHGVELLVQVLDDFFDVEVNLDDKFHPNAIDLVLVVVEEQVEDLLVESLLDGLRAEDGALDDVEDGEGNQLVGVDGVFFLQLELLGHYRDRLEKVQMRVFGLQFEDLFGYSRHFLVK